MHLSEVEHPTQNHAEVKQIFRVNVLGAIYLLDAVIPSMVERRRSNPRPPA